MLGKNLLKLLGPLQCAVPFRDGGRNKYDMLSLSEDRVPNLRAWGSIFRPVRDPDMTHVSLPYELRPTCLAIPKDMDPT